MPVTQTPFPHAASSFGLDRPVSRKVRYVDSTASNASNGNIGDSWLRPLATIEGVFSGAYSSETTAGTVVYVAQGHSETISAAAGIDADIAGVTIVGIGNGRNRPTINFTATAADIDIDAANITFENIYFDVTGIDAVVAAIDVNAADFTLKNCEVLMADSAGQASGFILTATASDRMKVIDCVIRSPDVGAEDAIDIVGVPDGIEIINTRILGDFLNAAIYNATGNVATNLFIKDSYLQNDQAGDHAIELVSAVTGVIANTLLVTDAIATAADLGSLRSFDLRFYDSSDADATATSYPETVTTGGHDMAAIETKADTLIARNAPRLVNKTVTFTAAAYETTTAVAVFTVTGDVMCRAVGVVTTAIEADAGADGAISLGIEDEVDTLCAVVVANETNFAAGDIWGTATTTKNGDVMNNTGDWVIIGIGADIEINVTVEDITAGVINLYVEWMPLSSGATVVAV